MALVEFNNDSTPYLNAENLNNNFNELNNNYNELNNNFIKLKGTVLYESESGSDTTITLSDSAANYSFIEIFYRAELIHDSKKIYLPNYKQISLCIDVLFDTSNYYKNSKWYVGNNIISLQGSNEYCINADGVQHWIPTSNKIFIYRVVGYK